MSGLHDKKRFSIFVELNKKQHLCNLEELCDNNRKREIWEKGGEMLNYFVLSKYETYHDKNIHHLEWEKKNIELRAQMEGLLFD